MSRQHTRNGHHCNLLGTNCSNPRTLIGSFSFGGATALNKATADSNSFPPFPPWTSTAQPKAVDRITSIVILLYNLQGGHVGKYKCFQKTEPGHAEVMKKYYRFPPISSQFICNIHTIIICTYIVFPSHFIHTYVHIYPQYVRIQQCSTHRQLHPLLKCFHSFPILCNCTDFSASRDVLLIRGSI